jgi:hypothetical protein
MQLYLDTSALVKLVIVEAETAALRAYLDECAPDIRMSSALARTELLRAAALHGSVEVVENARNIIARLDLVALSNRLLDAAAAIMPPQLRTLDAIHLAAALTVPDLRALVTYDSRLADAATSSGITVVAPGRPN